MLNSILSAFKYINIYLLYYIFMSSENLFNFWYFSINISYYRRKLFMRFIDAIIARGSMKVVISIMSFPFWNDIWIIFKYKKKYEQSWKRMFGWFSQNDRINLSSIKCIYFVIIYHLINLTWYLFIRSNFFK